ncbi:gem-associated protein 5-like isoform X2 [Cylas formicarius]|nr:gem-associated protein 5-like isoform X2 [Cylas formicarius]
MNKLVIPPSPNWYESGIGACAPDNTLVYGARGDIVVIQPTFLGEPDNVSIIGKAHSQRVISVSLNKNWGKPNKLAATVAEDKIVKVWNLWTLEKKISHDKHLNQEKVAGVAFAADDRVISVSENGVVVVWNVVLNQTRELSNLFDSKVVITCLSTCPHASWLTAFGLKSGLIVITDLRGSGKILYKLRGHDKPVVSLSWCPVPFNIFPIRPQNEVGGKDVKGKERIAPNSERHVEPSATKTHEIPGDTVNIPSPNLNVGEEVEPPQLNSFQNEDFKESLPNGAKSECVKEEVSTPTDRNIVDMDLDLTLNLKEGSISPATVGQRKENLDLVAPNLDAVVENIAKDKDSLLHLEETGEPIVSTEEARREFLLASSAREGNIYIWRAGTDGRLQAFINLTQSKAQSRKTRSYDKMFITLCWVSPNALLSSSKSGELFQWTLPKPQEVSKQSRLIHRDHHGLIFNISAPIKPLKESEASDEYNVWSLGQDRLVLNTDLQKERKNLNCYPTLGASITCFAQSPLDPNRLAVGTNDGHIKVWDLSVEHTKRIVFSSFYQKIQSKVTTLAWHPVQERLLAYGTAEGRVGIVDAVSESKLPKLFPDFFQSQIYRVDWGPMGGKNSHIGLYVVAQGKLVIFDIKAFDKDPTVVDVPDNTFVYTMSWKPDYTVMTLTTKSGALMIYGADLQLNRTLYLHQKLQSIVWHPAAATSTSRYSKVFATTEKFSECVVYDLSIQSDDSDRMVMAKFENRGCVVNCVAWNPHCETQLVMAGDDGVCQICDVEQDTVLLTYTDPNFDGVTTVIWSPLDSDFIVAGSVAQKLIIFKVSEQHFVPNSEITSLRNKRLAALTKEATDLLPKIKQTENEMNQKSSKNSSKSQILPVFYTPKETTQASDLRQLLSQKSSGEPSALQLFGSREDMLKIVDANIKTLNSRGKYQSSNTLSLWKGDINCAIKDAIKEKRVTPWILSLCPMVSPKLWQEGCDTYANQLMEEPNADPLEIVTYLLACHKLEQAVEVLCDRGLLREAYVLVKSRLPDDDPMVKTTLEKWAKGLTFNGSFEMAAECYIALGKYEEAASVLFRRSNADLLEVAVDIARKSGNEELLKAVLFRFNAFRNASPSCDG